MQDELPRLVAVAPLTWGRAIRKWKSLLALAGLTVFVVGLWSYLYRPWEAHYLGRPTSWWAARILPPESGRWHRRLPSPLGPLVDDLWGAFFRPISPYTTLAEDPTAIPVLLELHADPDPDVRLIAAGCLIDSGDEAMRLAVPVLAELLSAPRADQRSRAALDLAIIGLHSREVARPAVPALLRAMRDEDRQVRENAEEALAAIDPEAAKRPDVPVDEP